MPTIDNFIDKIICDDNLNVMRQMPDECIDLVVTDPPFGISFMGKHWDKALPPVDAWREMLRVMKPGAFAFIMCIPRQDCLSRMIVNLEDAGFMVNFTSLYHVFAQGFPKSANMSKLADRRLGMEREIVGKKGGRYKHAVPGATSNPMGQLLGTPGDWESAGNITVSASPEAKALEGSYAGFQPKPAVEMVLVVMRPLSEKTYLDQALANGKGISWLDGGRIPWKQGQAPSDARWAGNSDTRGDQNHSWMKGASSYQDPPQGRFAPNLLVSDDVLNDGKVRKVGGAGQPTQRKVGSCFPLGGNRSEVGYGDSGSFSRYFSLDAWADKNLPESVKRTFPFIIVPKASKGEKNAGLDGVKNTHPTVKSIRLISYLITIGSRPGDVILDPYCGSGTSCIAAAILDRRYVGMELDAAFVDISERRIKWHVEQARAGEQAQLKLDLTLKG